MSGFSGFRSVAVTVGILLLVAFSLWFFRVTGEEPVKKAYPVVDKQPVDKPGYGQSSYDVGMNSKSARVDTPMEKEPLVRSQTVRQDDSIDPSTQERRSRPDITKSLFSIFGQASILPPGLSESDIPAEYLNDLDHFKELLTDLGNVDEITEDGTDIQNIYFTSTLPDLARGTPYNQEYFSPYTGRIYAMFDCTSDPLVGKTHLLVKWFSSDTGNLLYEYMPISPGVSWNYIWKELEYWDPGEYKVEIHELPDELNLLASG